MLSRPVRIVRDDPGRLGRDSMTVKADPLIGVAADLVQRIPLVGKGKNQLADEEQAERRRYTEQVLEMLHDAKDRGLKDWIKVTEDEKFMPVRDRPDFKALTAPVKP